MRGISMPSVGYLKLLAISLLPFSVLLGRCSGWQGSEFLLFVLIGKEDGVWYLREVNIIWGNYEGCMLGKIG